MTDSPELEPRARSKMDDVLSLPDILSLDRLCWYWKSGADVTECLGLVLHKAMELSGSSCGALFTSSDAEKQPRASAMSGLNAACLRTPQRKEAGVLMEQGEIRPLDVSSPLFASLRKAGAESGFAVPMRADGVARGLIVLGLDRKSHSQKQIAGAASVARYTALAIERAVACKEAEEKLGFLEIIGQISAALVSERDLQATLAVVVEHAASLVDAESVAVGLLEEDGRALRSLYAVGRLAAVMEGRSFDTSEWPLRLVLASKKAQVIENPSSHPKVRPTDVREWKLTSALLAPLKLKDAVIGVLAAGNKRNGSHFTAADLRMFETLANHAAVAIGNSHLFESAKNALSRLEAERTKLEGILDNLADGVIVCDANQKIVLLNRAAEEILEVHAEKVIGSDLVSLQPAEYRKTIRKMLHAVSGAEGSETALYETKVEYGHKILRVSASPVVAGGICQGQAMVVQDITEAEEFGRAKSEFISTVAHELKTPLTSLKGSVGLMLAKASGTNDPQIRQLLDIADNNCNRLTRLVDDMMDIAKIEAGRMGLRVEMVSVYQCAVNAVNAVQQIAADKSVSLSVRLAGAPPLVAADRDRVEQVIMNLLANAIRFSPENGEVIASVRHIHGHVRVSVQDFGPGIPSKDLKRVFEKFYQVGGPASRKDGGTGLGLAISKAIVEQHGGKIYSKSILGQGSSFVFTIPVNATEGR